MAACQGYGNMGGGDCEDCVQVVKTTKKVRVPCHRNTYKQYTVKVPRNITVQEPQTVNYTDMVTTQEQVPYQCSKTEQRVRMDQQSYQVPVQKRTTKMVSVTKKVPKTIYVDVTTQEPKECTTTVMETRTKMVQIPYTVQVPVTKYRTVSKQVPVQRTKTVMQSVNKTVYDTQVRTRCEPKVTYVTREIPVYNVVAKPAAPCPPNTDCGQGAGAGMAASGMAASGGMAIGAGASMGAGMAASGGMGASGMAMGAGASMGAMGASGMAASGGMGGGGVSASMMSEFRSIDKNNDGMISAQEYAAARMGPSGGASAGYGMASGMGAGAAMSGMGASAMASGAQMGMAASNMRASAVSGVGMASGAGYGAQMATGAGYGAASTLPAPVPPPCDC